MASFQNISLSHLFTHDTPMLGKAQASFSRNSSSAKGDAILKVQVELYLCSISFFLFFFAPTKSENKHTQNTEKTFERKARLKSFSEALAAALIYTMAW